MSAEQVSGLSKDLFVEASDTAIARVKQLRQNVIDEYYTENKSLSSPLFENRQNPLDGARDNLIFVNEKLAPVIKPYFEYTGQTFDLGHAGLSLGGSGGFFYDSKFDCLVYAHTPYRKAVPVTERKLESLYIANINKTAVESFGKLSKIQILDEAILAILHPNIKNIKDTLRRFPGVN